MFLEKGAVKLITGVRMWSGDANLLSIVSEIGPGGTFGWSSLIEPYVATLSAVTDGDCNVVSIDAVGLRRLLDQDHDGGYCVMTALADLVRGRLRGVWEAWMDAKAADLRRSLPSKR